MRLPYSSELNEFNRILIVVDQLSGKGQSCAIRAVKRQCASVVLGGRPVDHQEMVRFCDYAGLVDYQKGSVRLTDNGREFLNLNPERTYEITDKQKQFIAQNIVLNGAWKSRARDLFLNFNPNYKEITYELGLIDNSLPKQYNSIVHLLKVLKVIAETEALLRVVPEYVASVKLLRADNRGITQDELEEALQADRKLGALAEEAVVEYERNRLLQLGCQVQADLVTRISQLDASAGYDIKSFDGDKSEVEHTRFIEVKASNNPEVRFFWSANELNVAREKGDRYWIYFIGDFRQSRREQIIPVMIQNPAKRLFEISELEIKTSTYIITEQDKLPLQLEHHGEIKGYLL